MERIRVDVIPKGLAPVCHASQYDTGRVIRLDLVELLQGYTLSDETAEIQVRKPDGHIVTDAVTVESGKTYIDIVTTEQMTACEGDNECELKISKDGAEICTVLFKMRVQKSVLEGGDPSESFIHDLNEQIAEAVAGQYTGDVIFDDAPTAGHGTPYAVTSEGVKNAVEAYDSLSKLADVDIDTPTSNQALVYDPVSDTWVNGEVSTVGSIDDLNDVDTTGKANGDSLRYDTNSSEWVAKPTIIECLQTQYDAWKNATPSQLKPLTEYVITDAPNLNPTASDIEYSSGVTVKQGLDNICSGVLSAERVLITPTASGVSNYGEGSYYYQRGKLTFVHINVQGLTANSQVTIFTMPSGARPVQSVYACGFCGNTYTGVANININASGVVKVASVDTYASVYVCYMAT